MIARIRTSIQDKDRGFTLIELLVVMIIIGILAAIAIPVFLNQRKSAVDASIKSDLRTVATALETSFVDKQAYSDITGTAPSLTVGGQPVTLSAGNTVSVTWLPAAATAATATGFCLRGTNPAGNAVSGSTTNIITYKSQSGGLSTTTC